MRNAENGRKLKKIKKNEKTAPNVKNAFVNCDD